MSEPKPVYKVTAREVVWFSPHCLNPVETLPLFAHVNGNGQQGVK